MAAVRTDVPAYAQVGSQPPACALVTGSKLPPLTPTTITAIEQAYDSLTTTAGGCPTTGTPTGHHAGHFPDPWCVAPAGSEIAGLRAYACRAIAPARLATLLDGWHSQSKISANPRNFQPCY